MRKDLREMGAIVEKVKKTKGRWDIDDSPKTNEEQIAELKELIELLKESDSTKEDASK